MHDVAQLPSIIVGCVTWSGQYGCTSNCAAAPLAKANNTVNEQSNMWLS